MTTVGHRREGRVSRIEAAFFLGGAGGRNNLKLRESERGKVLESL